MAISPSPAAARVSRRRVHYFSGFDPRGAAYYHRFMKEEGARPQPSGAQIDTGRRRKLKDGIQCWTTHWQPGAGADTDTAAVETAHEFMAWDDIIRAHWPKGAWALLKAFVLAYVGIVRDVDLRRVKRIHPTVALTGKLPALFLGVSLLAGIVLAALVAMVLGGLPGVVVGIGLGAGLVAASWTYGQRKGLLWLLRIFAYVVRMGRGPIDGMAQRHRSWVEHIIDRQQHDPVDEVLLVGHSVGALVIVEVVDALLRDPRWQALQGARKTCLLTLGQCLPFVALPPRAVGFRQALARLCDHPRLHWLDVTARIDPLCFYRAHPLALTGMEAGRTHRPVTLGARFFQMYESARWAGIRKDKLRTHFLYLMTPDRPGNFSFYDLLYGPEPFAQGSVPAAGIDPVVGSSACRCAMPRMALP